MWDVLSADFDNRITTRTMFDKCDIKGKPGSIIVFHDSEKAFRDCNMYFQEFFIFSEKGFKFLSLEATLESKIAFLESIYRL